MRYVVTGRAGSGKSAVAKELKSRGYAAYDTDDVAGLSSWQDLRSGRPERLKDDSFVDLDKYQWIWDRSTLIDFIEGKDQAFICGGADNEFQLEAFFDKHFALDVSPDVQLQRLKDRTNNDYGQDPRMFQRIIKDQQKHMALAHKFKATIIKADQPIRKVVDDILEIANV